MFGLTFGQVTLRGHPRSGMLVIQHAPVAIETVGLQLWARPRVLKERYPSVGPMGGYLE